MFITDNNGNEIEVTDLDKAIEQTQTIITFTHEDKNFKLLDKQLKTYWTDILQKLNQLKSNQSI